VASAQDGAILISSGAIAARVGGAFTLEDLGLRSFENVGDPVPVYRVAGSGTPAKLMPLSPPQQVSFPPHLFIGDSHLLLSIGGGCRHV
jgi:hypothetical protein